MENKNRNSIVIEFILLCLTIVIFSGISSLTVLASESHIVKGLVPKVSGDYRYQYCDICKGIAIIEYTGTDKILYVPESIDGIQVKEIADFAFVGSTTLEEVVLPKGLISLGNRSFYDCKNLKKINIPEGIKILKSIFYNCVSLTDISLPQSLIVIDGGAFQGCKSLETLVIPSGVQKIGTDAFRNCENLKNIQLPDGLRFIANRAFKGCKRLKKIEIPDSVLYIDAGAFSDCIALRKVTLPQKLYCLDREVFLNCTSLREVTIPGGLQYIERSAFRNCKKLKKIVFKGRKTRLISENAFKGIYKKAVFDVPQKAVKKYKSLLNKKSGFVKKTMKIK